MWDGLTEDQMRICISTGGDWHMLPTSSWVETKPLKQKEEWIKICGEVRGVSWVLLFLCFRRYLRNPVVNIMIHHSKLYLVFGPDGRWSTSFAFDESASLSGVGCIRWGDSCMGSADTMPNLFLLFPSVVVLGLVVAAFFFLSWKIKYENPCI